MTVSRGQHPSHLDPLKPAHDLFQLVDLVMDFFFGLSSFERVRSFIQYSLKFSSDLLKRVYISLCLRPQGLVSMRERQLEVH